MTGSPAAPRSAAPPDPWNLPALGRLSLRFAFACTVLGAALVASRPMVYAAVARIARDVVLWSGAPGLVTGLRWHEPLERFVLDSQALGVSVHIGSLSLAFLLVVPAAFTWALPRPRRLGAAALQLGVCLGVGSFIVGQDLLAIVSRTLAAQGIAPFGPWRTAFYEGWIRMGWDLAMIALPAALCLWALFPLLTGGDGAPPLRIRWRWAAGVVLAGVLLDVGAGARLADEASQGRFLRALAEREPALPSYLLGRGLASARAGRLRDAQAFLERAALFPSTEAQAQAALARIREPGR